MVTYPWNLLLRAVTEKGAVEIYVQDLEKFGAKEIFDLPSIEILRKIKLQISNPDMTDGEKVAFIKTLLE